MSARILAGAMSVWLLAAAPMWAQVNPLDKVAAVVNGEQIMQSEVKAIIEQRPLATPVPAEQASAIRRAALDMLVDDMLMRQFLRKNAGPVNPADIQKTIDDLKVVLQKQSKTIEQFLREEKIAERQLQADIITDLQWKNYLATRFSEADTRSYYEANKPFFDRVQVRASHVLKKVAQTAPLIEQQNAKAAMDRVKQEIDARQLTFEEAVKRYSECPSKQQAGDIGFFTYKFMVVDEFARAAFNLPVGQMSGVVRTQFGFHLIKVTDRNPGEASTYEGVRDGVRKTMAQEQELFQRILSEQKRTAQIQVQMQ